MRLAQAGITPADAYLVSVTRKVGASPLSLKLAAELVRREGKEGLRDPEKLRDILFRLGDAEVQAVPVRAPSWTTWRTPICSASPARG
ncbi:hypothetical protein STANM309S_02886 [Streptomyces tanashiensis]